MPLQDDTALDDEVLDACPQALLLDASYPRATEIAAHAQVAHPHLQIFVLAGGDPREESFAWPRIGISAYVRQETSLRELGEMLRQSFAARPAQSPVVSAPPGRPTPATIVALTSREREILDFLAEGLSNKEIARQLGISAATVKNHVHNILAKLNAGSRFAAAAQLRRQELLGKRIMPFPQSRAAPLLG